MLSKDDCDMILAEINNEYQFHPTPELLALRLQVLARRESRKR